MLASSTNLSTAISMARTFDSQYDCLMFGYKESMNKMEQIGRKEINEHGMFVKFYCTPQQTI
jgi:hypothetical protein